MNCKICYEKYDKENHKPITLMPCGHSLCTNCLVELKKQYPVVCPACRNGVSCEKPNYDLIDLLDINLKSDAKVSIRRSINKELKEFKEMFKEFCAHSDRIIQESSNRRDELKSEIDQKTNEWITIIKTNQADLYTQVDFLHINLAERVQKLMSEQMTRQLKSKNLKHMDQNELLEFRIDLGKFKSELNEKIDKLIKFKYNHTIELNDECFLNTQHKIETETANLTTVVPVPVQNSIDQIENSVEKANITQEKMNLIDGPRSLEKSLIIEQPKQIERPILVEQTNTIAVTPNITEKQSFVERSPSLEKHCLLIEKPVSLQNGMVCGFVDMNVKVWNIKEGNCTNTFSGHSKIVTCLMVISGNRLVTGSEDKTIKIWDIKTNTCQHTLTGHIDVVECILNVSKETIASGAGTGDKTLRIWNTDTGECTNTLIDVHKGGAFSLCLQSKMEDILISGGGYGSIKFTNYKTGQRVKILNGHSARVIGLRVSNGETLLSSSDDKTVKLWDIHSGTCISALKLLSEYFYRSIQSTSNGKLVSVSDDVSIKVWNIKTGECVHTLTGHTNIVLCILLVTDTILASGSWDSTIKIWDIERNVCLKTLKGHTERVYNIQLVANHIILSASHDKTIKIWNILTGECLNSIKIGTNDVKYLNVLGYV